MLVCDNCGKGVDGREPVGLDLCIYNFIPEPYHGGAGTPVPTGSRRWDMGVKTLVLCNDCEGLFVAAILEVREHYRAYERVHVAKDKEKADAGM